MLDLEKMVARSRTVLHLISVVGFLVLVGGGILIGMVAANNKDFAPAMSQMAGPMTLAAAGLLLTCMPFGILQVVSILQRRAQDDRFHREQMISAAEAQTKVLGQLKEVASLSDAAKQVAYRAKDLEALRAAIREDLNRGDFEAATMLVNEMERRFGYAQEVDRVREQINEKSRAAIDQRVADTVEHVELLLTRYDWADATRESDRLLRLFPTHPEARKLAGKIHRARDDHKRDLLKMWREAVAKDDVDRSLELLRELDPYLSVAEAEAYKENARDVFRKKLQQLGVQFALHVHDKSWNEALRIGRQITDEFPNTRMAAEVREKMPILEDKVGRAVGV
jgi:hypothetical protein